MTRNAFLRRRHRGRPTVHPGTPDPVCPERPAPGRPGAPRPPEKPAIRRSIRGSSPERPPPRHPAPRRRRAVRRHRPGSRAATIVRESPRSAGVTPINARRRRRCLLGARKSEPARRRVREAPFSIESAVDLPAPRSGPAIPALRPFEMQRKASERPSPRRSFSRAPAASIGLSIFVPLPGRAGLQRRKRNYCLVRLREGEVSRMAGVSVREKPASCRLALREMSEDQPSAAVSHHLEIVWSPWQSWPSWRRRSSISPPKARWRVRPSGATGRGP